MLWLLNKIQLQIINQNAQNELNRFKKYDSSQKIQCEDTDRQQRHHSWWFSWQSWWRRGATFRFPRWTGRHRPSGSGCRSWPWCIRSAGCISHPRFVSLRKAHRHRGHRPSERKRWTGSIRRTPAWFSWDPLRSHGRHRTYPWRWNSIFD